MEATCAARTPAGELQATGSHPEESEVLSDSRRDKAAVRTQGTCALISLSPPQRT